MIGDIANHISTKYSFEKLLNLAWNIKVYITFSAQDAFLK
jgi:hypothetical protein